MAGEDPVAEFLALIQQEKYTEAAKDFDDLVVHFCPAGKRMTPQQEQELHLRPAKPFKKLRKLIESKATLEGLLSILCRDHEGAFLVLNSMCALSRAPGFAKQIGACGAAASLRQCATWLFPRVSSINPPNPARAPPLTLQEGELIKAAGAYMKAVANYVDLSPDFSHQAIEQRLPEVITASFPWGQPLPGWRNSERNSALLRLAMMVGEAFSAFMDSPEKALPLAGCNVDINAWLVRYVGFLRGTAEALVPKVLFEKDHSEVQACAKVVLQHFNMENNAAVLLDRANLEPLEAAVTALLPHLGKGSRFQVDSFLSAVHALRSGSNEAVTSGGQNETDLGNVLRSLEGLVLEDRRGFNSQFDGFYESYKALAATSPAALLSGELLDVLTTGFVEKVKAPGRLSEDSREILRSLEDALTVAQLMRFEADIFDHVALKLLRHVEPALDKLGGTAFQHLLGVFMECYRGGGEQTRPAKVWSGVLVAILELDIDQKIAPASVALPRHSGWVLREWDATLVERSVTLENGNQAVVEGRPLAPREDRRALAQDIATRQKGRLFPPALRVFLHHMNYGVYDADRVEDVAGVLLWCCSDEGLLEKKLLPIIELVVQILGLEYEQLSKKCQAEEVTEAEYRGPWPDKCRPLAALLRLAFEWARSKPALNKALLEEVSRSGGVELCRAVLRDARKKAVLGAKKPKEGDLQ